MTVITRRAWPHHSLDFNSPSLACCPPLMLMGRWTWTKGNRFQAFTLIFLISCKLSWVKRGTSAQEPQTQWDHEENEKHAQCYQTSDLSFSINEDCVHVNLPSFLQQNVSVFIRRVCLHSSIKQTPLMHMIASWYTTISLYLTYVFLVALIPSTYFIPPSCSYALHLCSISP